MGCLGSHSCQCAGVHSAHGSFEIPDIDLAVAITFGALASVLDLVTSCDGQEDAAARFAESMLRMVGLPLHEAQEVVARSLPEVETSHQTPDG